MDNRYYFKFQLLKIFPFKKGDTKMARLEVYCEFGYIIELFTTEEKARDMEEKSKTKNKDITDYISVYYNKKDNIFKYYIKN